MCFGCYLAGYALLVTGLAYAAYLIEVPAYWIWAVVLMLSGIGVFSGMRYSRQKNPE